MTTQSKYQFASIVLILLITLLGVTYKAVMSGAMDIQQTLRAVAGTRLTQVTALPYEVGVKAEAQEAPLNLAEPVSRPANIARPEEVVSMMALPSRSIAWTQSVIKLYKSPDSTGEIAGIITPGLPVTILGRNANGTYLAVNPDNQEDQVIAWVAAGDLALEPVWTHTRSVAKVYRQPNSDSAITGTLTPNQVVSLIGTNSESSWYAVASVGYAQRLIGWVPTIELQMKAPTGEMLYFTKTHLEADEASSIVEVLWPTMKVSLLGRSQDGTWVAVASEDGSKFKGWARASEVKVTGDLQTLPVLTTH